MNEEIVISGNLKDGKYFRANERWAKVMKASPKRSYLSLGIGEETTAIAHRNFVHSHLAESEAKRYIETGEYT